MSKRVGVAVITHNAKNHLSRCLPPLLSSPLKPRVLVVNSSSEDGTVEEAERLGAETLVIPRSDFNHGTTRERARRALDTEIVVMITPDAYALDETMLEKLVEPIASGQAQIAYSRQIAHEGADFFETFPRAFNYPHESHIRGIEDLPKWGVYTFFCSNSCAAYLNAALDEAGGFPFVLLGEDTIACARILRRGGKIAYAAEAVFRHSHRYSLKQEFQRNFDTGLARKEIEELISGGGSDSKRGAAYVKEMMKTLWQVRPLMIPYGFLQVLAKWSGYQIGRRSVAASNRFKKRLSSQDFFWQA